MNVVRSAGVLVFLVLAPSPVSSQIPSDPAEMFGAFCAVCHAEDGTGQVFNPAIDTEAMDFTDCGLSTPEPDLDWQLAIALGGPAVGLSSEMPSFGDALNEGQIQGLIAYIRTFCTEPGWPLGNVNFPRPVFTEKAFPEDEVVILPVVSHGGQRDVGFRLRSVFEKRVGKRGHVEIGLPFETVGVGGSRASGVGDVSIAGKYVLHTDRRSTRIVTGGLELSFPTGSERRDLGEGTAVLEPYLAAGTTVRDVYLQTQVKLELPARAPWADHELVYNLYAGRDLSELLNTWTIGIELNGVDERVAITPQLRKGLTRTGALAVAGGVRIPINHRDQQATRWVGYLLWEYLEPVFASER